MIDEMKRPLDHDPFYENLAGQLYWSDVQIATILVGLNADTLVRLSEQTRDEIRHRITTIDLNREHRDVVERHG